MAKKWFIELRPTSTSEAECFESPIETPKTIEEVKIVRKVKLREFPEDISISHLYENAIRKMSAVFAHIRPQIQGCDNFECVFGVFHPFFNKCLRRFITGNEIWTHHNTQETEKESTQ